jgi:hypothetical protein
MGVVVHVLRQFSWSSLICGGESLHHPMMVTMDSSILVGCGLQLR